MINLDAAPQLTLPVGLRDHRQGPDDAPVTLVEYGDYQCPHCGAAYPILKQVQEQMGERLLFVFRNFPLTTTHPNAQHAAESAEIAGAQGKFWEMHAALFENQHMLADSDLAQYAARIGLDVPAFSRDLAAHVQAPRVREDFRSGVHSGVNGTPTFYIQGRRYDGAWDMRTLVHVLMKASR